MGIYADQVVDFAGMGRFIVLAVSEAGDVIRIRPIEDHAIRSYPMTRLSDGFVAVHGPDLLRGVAVNPGVYA